MKVKEYRVELQTVYKEGQNCLGGGGVSDKLPDECSKSEFLVICADLYDTYGHLLEVKDDN